MESDASTPLRYPGDHLTRMRICHLTTVHDWNDVRIFVKMSQSGSSEGYLVDLIAPVRWNNPVIDSGAITVHGLRRYRSRILRSSLGTLRAIRKATTIRASIYHLHDPELLPAVIALRLLGRRVVFDFHEEFSAQMRGKPYLGRRSRAIAFRLARCWELILCGAASKIVTATRGFVIVCPYEVRPRPWYVTSLPSTNFQLPPVLDSIAAPRRLTTLGELPRSAAVLKWCRRRACWDQPVAISRF